MAQFIGQLRENATKGETLTYNALKQGLRGKDDYYVYVEWLIGTEETGKPRRPDFLILHRDLGIVIIEVKDWRSFSVKKDKVIEESNRHAPREQKDPSLQAKQYVDIIREDMSHYDVLTNSRGVCVPVNFVLLFPYITNRKIYKAEKYWGAKGQVLCGLDLRPKLIEDRIRNIPRFFEPAFSDYQFNAVREALDPEFLKVESTDGTHLGTLSLEQELLVKEPDKQQTTTTSGPTSEQLNLFKEELPESAAHAARNTSVRLVRGVPGSGKSLVLARRAAWLKNRHPDWNILVLTYNRKLAEDLQKKLSLLADIHITNFHAWCRKFIEPHRGWEQDFSNIDSWVRSRFSEWPELQDLDYDYVAAELKWRKDMSVFDNATYLEIARTGRGRALGRNQRTIINDMFSTYLQWQREPFGAWDWEDLPHIFHELIDTGSVQPAQYDAIMVDEAQDFAPSWMTIIKAMLKPNGMIFLADDPAQSIFRYYSWREKGIEVVGRTRWLRIPYRNTREIHRAAFALIEGDEGLQQEARLIGGEATQPDLQTHLLRSGPKPQRVEAQGKWSEYKFVEEKIKQWIAEGIDPAEIGVLHPRKYGRNDLRKFLPKDVNVDTIQAVKGLEYRFVFLCGMQDIFESLDKNIVSYPEKVSELRKLVYMAMTRAQEELYLCYTLRWPKELQPIEPYTDHVML